MFFLGPSWSAKWGFDESVGDWPRCGGLPSEKKSITVSDTRINTRGVLHARGLPCPPLPVLALIVLRYEPQELRPAADRGALHPERAPFLQWLQQGVQWRGVPLWQQLPGPERAERGAGKPGQRAAFPCPRAVQPGGAGGRLEQRAWSWHLGYQRWAFDLWLSVADNWILISVLLLVY